MKKFLFFFLLSLPAYSQSYQVSVGSNLTSYLFVNSASTNPANMRPASGMHLSIHREKALSNDFFFSLVVKGRVSAVKMINGNQMLLNRYIDLADDEQFNSIRTMYGLSLELRKQINPQVSTFVSYQYLTSYKQFIEPNRIGKSTINFIPTTFSIGLVLSKSPSL
jgi:hypothetical protein